ncbi:uncharacterized protein LOC106132312 [Amyelois transitella]|uniref:uncharacterized protein LOC106132312 n=1 Tax=Amyelois transitella TaxID=680683 RepID=UPI00298F62C9|nr:uncharacterized protein LOC106132312 [Amyelois transitella]
MVDREVLLHHMAEDIAKKHNYNDAKIKIEPISTEGANYSSVLFNITISATTKKDLHLFAKVLNFNESVRSSMGGLIIEIEGWVYEDLAGIFKKIEDKCEVPDKFRYVFPEFYGYNPKLYAETLILENLVARGFEVYDRLKSIDWPYAAKAVETLAKFHALSMAYGKENPEIYEKKFGNNIEIALKPLGERFNDFVETALSVLKEENKERLRQFRDKEQSQGNVFVKYMTMKSKPVLAHGDYRPSNIMHKVNKDGTIDLIPIDYQTVNGGNCITDLLYFIFSGSDSQFRERYYQRLIDHYYDSLKAALIRLKLNPDEIYSRKDFDSELKRILPYGLLCALLVLPVVTVTSENAPDLNSADMFERLAKPKTSPQYKDRINGVIDDYIKWGIL